MKHISIIILFFLISSIGFSQEKTTKHIVIQGETVTQIAKKYKVTEDAIFKLNPEAKNGLKLNSVLKIPNSTTTEKKVEEVTQTSHKVETKETVYGIAKKYNITVSDLIKANPSVETEGLKDGQMIVVPSKKWLKSNNEKPAKTEKPKSKDETVFHEVVAKDSKYSIAKKYNLTVEQLEKQNPEMTDNLQIGYNIYISGKKPAKTATKTTTPVDIKVVSETKPIAVILENKLPKNTEYVNYEVKPKETLYSLARMFSMSQDNLIALNPDLKNGVLEKMILKVPSTTSLKPEVKKEKSDLGRFIKNGEKKQLALLLPFNMSKIEGDTINSQGQRLKKDAFLNMTLDFYAGALVAIDSARTLGMNIDVKILDSKETKTSSNVENLVSQNNLQNFNAVVGPFYQIHSDKLAGLLEANNVPVISPLSKDAGKSYKNMYSTMSSGEYVKDAMFDYMHDKSGNIIAVVDIKKISIKQYILENHKDVKFATLDDKGSLQAESLKGLLVKDKVNYVVMASERTGMIFATTNVLLNALKEYQIRLVILEPNATLDFDEIALSRLTKLKLTYPSLIRENESAGAKIFENTYKKKNKIQPSQYAARGFDITFDTMMRLSQNKTFEETINGSATEQVESKFDYEKKLTGGYINKGIFILQYNPDLTISEAE
jgi:LysM repeat protein